MELIQRVLVVCGATRSCDELVHAAALIARSLHARLYVLSVVDDPFGVRGLSFPRPTLKGDFRRLIDKTKKGLREIINREQQHGLVVQEQIREGRPFDRIMDAIREDRIDLLILPAHHEWRLEHFLFGGKNKALLRVLPCSLLFIKSEPLAAVEEEGEEEAPARRRKRHKQRARFF